MWTTLKVLCLSVVVVSGLTACLGLPTDLAASSASYFAGSGTQQQTPDTDGDDDSESDPESDTDPESDPDIETDTAIN